MQTERYVAVYPHDVWSTAQPSEVGWFVHRPNDFDHAWLGLQLKEALAASSFRGLKARNSEFEVYKRKIQEAKEKRETAWSQLAQEYKYKDKDAAQRKAKLLIIYWYFDRGQLLDMRATKRFRGGKYSAWPEGKNVGRVFQADYDDPVEVLGEMVAVALTRCE